MILNETYRLLNGIEIPRLGLGTWFIENGRAAQIVRDAAEIGYRHFDTAQAYGNEEGVGEGVRTCGIAREELFVTTKLEAGVKSYAEAKAAINGSLKSLGLEHIDMMIIHSPKPWPEFGGSEHFFEGNLDAWRALEEAHNTGKLRAIGVSNFEKVDLDNILDNGSVKPLVNQILAHVGNTPFDLIEYSQGKGILVEAYSPVGHGKMLGNQELAAMAETYGATVAQLCIRYCLQLGMLPLPKSGNPSHIRSNSEVDFAISGRDMAKLKDFTPIEDYGEANVFPVFAQNIPAGGAPAGKS